MNKTSRIPQLSIIIVNFKTPHITNACIKSIYNSEIGVSFEVIVVDNCSNDNSKDIILKKFPKVRWVQSSYNSGFGRGNNLGVSHANGKYILLINSDLELSQNSKLSVCINYLEKNPYIGVLGCKLLNEDFSTQKSVYYDVGTLKNLLSYNILWQKVFGQKPKSIDAVMGAFMLMRKEYFNQLNGFDPDFFMYAEELELCMRIKKNGKQVHYFKDYAVIHKHGASSPAKWAHKQNLLSNALLYFKLNGVIGYIAYHLVFHVNIICNLALWFRIKKKDRKAFMNTYKAYFSSYPKYLFIPFYYTFARNRKFLKAN